MRSDINVDSSTSLISLISTLKSYVNMLKDAGGMCRQPFPPSFGIELQRCG